MVPRSGPLARVVDIARAAMIQRKGHFFSAAGCSRCRASSRWSAMTIACRSLSSPELVDEAPLEKTILALNGDKSCDRESAGRIWPYFQMKWMLARLPVAIDLGNKPGLSCLT
jgi:hypothetical protein